MNRVTSIACPVACSFGVASGNEPLPTLRTTSTSGIASRSERPACQCVYQRRIGTRSTFVKRSRQQHEQRHHVHDDGIRSCASRQQRSRGGASETHAAPEARAGAEGPERDVAGQVVPPHRVADDGDRLATRGQRAHEIDGLRQYRVVCVHRLGDEDEPHGQRAVPAIAASTSARISPASCAGVECQSA